MLSLAGSVGGVLKKLHSFRHGPDEFLALINEIADFEIVVRNVIDICDLDSPPCKNKV